MATRKKLTPKPESTAGVRVNKSQAEQLCNRGQPQGEDVGNLCSEPVGPPFAGDLILFLEFVDPSLSDDELSTHPVMRKIETLAPVVAWKHRYPDLRFALVDEGFISLRTQSKYSGQGPLDAYILTVLNNKVPQLKRPLVPGKLKFVKQDDEIPEGVAYSAWRYEWLDDEACNLRSKLPDVSTLNLADKILAAIYMDECMRKLIAKSDLHGVVADMIGDFIRGEEEDDDQADHPGGWLTDRRIAQTASKRLGRKVTRYRAGIVLQQFKPILVELLRP
jgi:hypothetical protein